ncbi:MAG: M16 family metallopeptidase, partial [Bacteroidia bacterium]
LEVPYPTVPSYHPDEPALDVLAFVLGNGNNSILYKNFVKSEKTARASANHGSEELGGEFSFTILSYPDGDVDVEKLLAQTLDEFDQKGVDDDAMARFKNQFESSILQNIGTVSEKANLLYSWNYLLGTKPWNVNNELDRYNKVTKEDVMRVFRTYVKGKYSANVTVFPKHEKFTTNAAVNKDVKEDTKLSTTSGEAKQELEYKGLTYKKTVDNFDRSKQPPYGSPVYPTIPKSYKTKLENGMTIIGTESQESPYVDIIINIRGGNYAAGNDLSKSGHALFTSLMMEEATQKYTSEQFSNEIEKLGAAINFSASNEFTTVRFTAPKKNLNKALELFEEKLMHPKFLPEDFKRLQKMLGASISQSKQTAQFMASISFAKLLYGKSIVSESPLGTIKSLKGMQLKDVQAYYDNFYNPSYSTLVVVGDVTESEIMPKLSFLKNWKKKDAQLPLVTVTPQKIEKTKIYLVDKYKAPQSIIVMGYVSCRLITTGNFTKHVS